jgi:hypothetical protein
VIKVKCQRKRTCRGLLKVQRGPAVLINKRVQVRAGRSATFRIKARASISVRHSLEPLRLSGPAGTRVSVG